MTQPSLSNLVTQVVQQTYEIKAKMIYLPHILTITPYTKIGNAITVNMM
jgi:hypothetical protein